MRFSADTLVTKLWFNIVWFQLCWLSAVWLQQPILVAALLSLHLALVANKKQEVVLLILCALPGLLLDSLLTSLGLFQFPSEITLLLPSWLILLWLCFCATFNLSLKFFANHLWLSAFAGAIGGSSSYLAGHNLNAVVLGHNLITSTLLLAVIWALLLPLLFNLHKNLRQQLKHLT